MTIESIDDAVKAAQTGVLPGVTAEPAEDVSESSVNWAEMADDSEGVQEHGGEAKVAGEETQPISPEAPPAAEAPAEGVQQTEQAAEEPVAEPEIEVPPAPTPEQVAAHRAEYISKLEKAYALDPESARQMITEPEVVLPKLAAQLHATVVDQVLATIRTVMPQQIEHTQRAAQVEQKAKQEFFDAWPELKGYEKQVLDIGRMYRQLNPTANAKEAIERIGSTAMAALGLTRAQQAAAMQQPTPKPREHRPAGVGRVTTPPAKPTDWESLAEDD